MSVALEPFRFAATLPEQTSKWWTAFFGSRKLLEDERDALEEALLKEKARLQSLDFFVKQNHQLREMLDLFQTAGASWIAADISRNITGRQGERIYINKGLNDNIAPGMGVVGVKGAIGQIVRVDSNTAVVSLLSDANQWFAARNKRNGIFIILRGVGDGSDEMISENMPVNADVQIGDEIVANDGILPGGYPIGKVLSVESNIPHLLVRVAPTEDFFIHKTVLVYALPDEQ